MGLAHRLLKPCRLLCLAPWIEWAPRTFENDQSILLTGKRGGRGERGERGERSHCLERGERGRSTTNQTPDPNPKAMFTLKAVTFIRHRIRDECLGEAISHAELIQSDLISLPGRRAVPLPSSLAKTTHTQSQRPNSAPGLIWARLNSLRTTQK